MPWLPRALYEAFTEAKRLAYRRLADTAVLPYVLPWLVAEVEETRALMGDDPFPYGVARNRKTVETLAGYSSTRSTWSGACSPRRLGPASRGVHHLRFVDGSYVRLTGGAGPNRSR